MAAACATARRAALAALAWTVVPVAAWGQAGIYTCTDGQGRRITSDRPIAECLDRDQKQLNPSGTVRRHVPPNPTAQERASEEERQRKVADEEARLADERRRDRALLTRYATPAAHDAERAQALAQVDEVVVLAEQRLADLARQRAALVADQDGRGKDRAKPTAAWLQQVQDNDQAQEAQKRFIADQAQEKQRIHARFDAERARLRLLWGAAAPAVNPASSSATR